MWIANLAGYILNSPSLEEKQKQNILLIAYYTCYGMQSAWPLPLPKIKIGGSDVLSCLCWRKFQDAHSAVPPVVIVTKTCALVAGWWPGPPPSSTSSGILVGCRSGFFRRKDRSQKGIGTTTAITIYKKDREILL